MSKSKNTLILFLVMMTLLAFICITLYSFYLSLTGNGQLTERLTYITNTLAGLVGGIVASAFGVEPPPPVTALNQSRYRMKMATIGNFVTTGKFRSELAPDTARVILGNLYAWAYLLLGLSAIVIWALDLSTLTVIDNLATITLGLILVIVKNFLE